MKLACDPHQTLPDPPLCWITRTFLIGRVLVMIIVAIWCIVR